MLEIRHLNKIYKTKKQTKQALKDINLIFPDKGFVTILGKSGSGKSTLLNILGGLDTLDSGEIVIKGESTKNFKPGDWDSYRSTYVGTVFQEFYLIDQFTVGKNIALSLELQGEAPEKIGNRVKELLKQVGLEDYENRVPYELSGGQKQRIAIARALIKNPEIILADEPTGNLDNETGKLIMETLKTLSETKLVVMVTHDHDFAYIYGDRVIEIADGEIISDRLKEGETEETFYNVNGVKLFRVPGGQILSPKLIMDLRGAAGTNRYLSLVTNKKYLRTFLPEGNQAIPEITVSGHLSLKKTALPFHYALNLAFHSIFKKKVLLVFMSLLFIFSLTFMGVALNFTYYNPAKAANLTFERAGVKFVPLTKVQKENNIQYQAPITEDDVTYFENTYPDLLFLTGYSRTLSLTDLFGAKNLEHHVTDSYSTFYTDAFNHVDLTDNAQGIYPVIGSLPGYNEVAITDYMAEVIMDNHLVPGVTDQTDLIGKTMTCNHIPVTISGIITTDYAQYNNLKDVTDESLLWNSGFLTKKMSDYEHIYMTKQTYEDTFFLSQSASYFHVNDITQGIQTDISIPDSDYNSNLSGTLPVNDDDLVITLSMLNSLGFNIDQDNMATYIGTDLTLKYYKISLFQNTDVTKKFHISGIINDERLTDLPFQMMFTKAEFQEIIKDQSSGMDRTLTAVLSDNTGENAAFINDLYLLDFQHNTPYSSSIDSLKYNADSLKVLFMITGGVFALFAALLIFVLMSGSINHKQKEIGTLRAMGAKGSDVAKIFVTEGGILALFAGIAASVATAGLTLLFNHQFTKDFHMKIVLLYVNWLSILSVFLVSVVVMTLATFIPISRITRMKPIKAIKGLN